MTSENMDGQTASKKRVYIYIPTVFRAAFAEHYELDHGLIIKELNPYINEGYLRAYFREWGTVTLCKIMKILKNSNENKHIAYVRFSSEDEANRAEWAGPHDIGGEVVVRRVVSPKVEDSSDDEKKGDAVTFATKPRPRRSMGLGYVLEDAQWLDDGMEE